MALGVGSSITEECLSRMVFLGKAQLQHAVTQYMMHYYEERNHQGIDNRLPPARRWLSQHCRRDNSPPATWRYAQFLSSCSSVICFVSLFGH